MPAPITEDRYRYVFDMLAREAADLPVAGRPEALAKAVAARVLTKASRRFYAAAVRYCLEDDPTELSRFNEALKGESQVVVPTQRRQAYEVPPALFSAVLEVLDENAENWTCAMKLKALIIAVRHFGLRPCEWESAYWLDQEKNVVVVPNAKFADTVIERGPKKGAVWRRGNGEVREIRIQRMYHETLVAIADAAMAVAKEMPYSDPVNAATFRRTHRWALEALRGRGIARSDILDRITIYSYRHTFSSEAKASVDLTRGEVAALMGHISIKTAIQSYARRSKKGGLKVRPTKKSVDAVLVRSKLFRPGSGIDLDNKHSAKSSVPNREWPSKGPVV